MLSARALDFRHRQSLAEALGPDLRAFLRDPEILEISLNPDGSLWLDRASGLEETDVVLDGPRTEALLTTIAGLLGQELTHRSPVLEGELPFDGSRVTALLPPVVLAPTFTIRKRARRIYRLHDYLEAGILDARAAALLAAAVAPRNPNHDPKNVVLAGGPGSGKTTLANALLAEIAEAPGRIQRLILLEDTFELQCAAPCQVPMRTTDRLDLRALVRKAMRLHAHRIVVGEVRGAEAHELLKAWNTGTPGGLATVHANSAVDALDRLDHLAQEAGVRSAARLVGSTVHLVAFINRTARGRRVEQLIRVGGYDPTDGYQTDPCLKETP